MLCVINFFLELVLKQVNFFLFLSFFSVSLAQGRPLRDFFRNRVSLMPNTLFLKRLHLDPMLEKLLKNKNLKPKDVLDFEVKVLPVDQNSCQLVILEPSLFLALFYEFCLAIVIGTKQDDDLYPQRLVEEELQGLLPKDHILYIALLNYVQDLWVRVHQGSLTRYYGDLVDEIEKAKAAENNFDVGRNFVAFALEKNLFPFQEGLNHFLRFDSEMYFDTENDFDKGELTNFLNDNGLDR
jgi:hypothetical protein